MRAMLDQDSCQDPCCYALVSARMPGQSCAHRPHQTASELRILTIVASRSNLLNVPSTGAGALIFTSPGFQAFHATCCLWPLISSSFAPRATLPARVSSLALTVVGTEKVKHVPSMHSRIFHGCPNLVVLKIASVEVHIVIVFDKDAGRIQV